jgi:hypothetical protein
MGSTPRNGGKMWRPLHELDKTSPVLKAVTLHEIEKVFGVIERHGLSREAVVIPLRPASPGNVKMLANGKLEITVDGDVPIDEWLSTLDAKITALMQKR